MFDVTDKRAVDRLAAVVAMLEQREREARAEHLAAREQYNGDARRGKVGQYVEDARPEQLALHRADARWAEARSALTAARELATDR